MACLAVVALAFAGGAGAVLGARHQNEHWVPLYNQQVAQVAHWKSDVRNWQGSSAFYQKQLKDLRSQVSTSVGSLDSPHFVLWNSCGAGGPSAGCPLTPGYEYVGGVPDTFTYFVSFHATVPVTVRIFSAHDYVCWESGNCPSHYVWWSNITKLRNGTFHDAEGCAGYIAVFTSKEAGTLYPNVSITRNPAQESTGACA